MIVSYPNQIRNYCVFSPSVNERIKRGEGEIPSIKESLNNPKSEDEVVEDLYILNCMIDEGVEVNKIAELYPELSRYNNTNSPNIQTYLAGIYRKTKIPDAFGPLISMLIKNSIKQANRDNSISNNDFKSYIFGDSINTFDPNEEIGGAVLNYLA